jgi:hypothetical protein
MPRNAGWRAKSWMKSVFQSEAKSPEMIWLFYLACNCVNRTPRKCPVRQRSQPARQAQKI